MQSNTELCYKNCAKNRGYFCVYVHYQHNCKMVSFRIRTSREKDREGESIHIG